MTISPLFICNIWQKDLYTFAIEWNTGIVHSFRLSHVQRACPCAKCRDAKNKGHVCDVTEDVSALLIRSVGRYGIRIQFTSGCSSGIYSFDALYQLAEEHTC